MAYDTEQKPGEFTPEIILDGRVEAGSMVTNFRTKILSAAEAFATEEPSIVIGIAQSDGDAGDAVILRRGVFAFHSDGDTAIPPGQPVYVVDNETVNSNGEVAAGISLGMDADGMVLVDIDQAHAADAARIIQEI